MRVERTASTGRDAERHPRPCKKRVPFTEPRRFTPMVAPAVAHREALRRDLLRALARAQAERIVVFRRDACTLGVAVAAAGGLLVKPYLVAVTGAEPGDVACSCPAGAAGRACKHLAAAIF